MTTSLTTLVTVVAHGPSPLLGLGTAENSKGVIRSYFPDSIWAWSIAHDHDHDPLQPDTSGDAIHTSITHVTPPHVNFGEADHHRYTERIGGVTGGPSRLELGTAGGDFDDHISRYDQSAGPFPPFRLQGVRRRPRHASWP
jgi:hypothetical protein